MRKNSQVNTSPKPSMSSLVVSCASPAKHKSRAWVTGGATAQASVMCKLAKCRGQPAGGGNQTCRFAVPAAQLRRQEDDCGGCREMVEQPDRLSGGCHALIACVIWSQ